MMHAFKQASFLGVLSFLVLLSVSNAGKRTQQDMQQIQNKLKLDDGRELVPVVEVEGKEFFVNSQYTNMSWTEAVAYCADFNMTIGETVTAHQHQQVYLFVPLFYNYWLGGTNNGSAMNEWYWITDEIPFNYNRWGSGQPNPRNSCLYAIEDIQIWWTIDCLDHSGEPEEIYVLCQRPAIAK